MECFPFIKAKCNRTTLVSGYSNRMFLLLRSGELCRQRWNQMVRLIGGHRDKPFIEQVEVLARRYCPEMLPYRKSKAGELSADELAGVSDL